MLLLNEQNEQLAKEKEPLKDELLNTFTPELAHMAYFSVSRHISKY